MKAEFLTPLRTEKLDSKFYELLSPLRYYSKLCYENIIVPEGFVTDFASVPRVPLAYLLCGNTAHRAAVVHDYLYRQGWKRDIADRVLYEACRATGMSWWRSRLIYTAVRICGWACYTPLPGVLDPR